VSGLLCYFERIHIHGVMLAFYFCLMSSMLIVYEILNALKSDGCYSHFLLNSPSVKTNMAGEYRRTARMYVFFGAIKKVTATFRYDNAHKVHLRM
jgi:hypothetical protein